MRFILGNRTQFLNVEGGNQYDWELFLECMEGEAPLSNFADTVEVILHPTFTPSKLKYHPKERRPILLRRLGWGTFRIEIKVYWKKDYNERMSEFHHDL